jgi:hypothetical protein
MTPLRIPLTDALALIAPVDAIYRAMQDEATEAGVDIDHFVATVAEGVTVGGGGHIVLRAGTSSVILGQNFADGSWTILATGGTDREVVSTHPVDTAAADLASAAIAAFLER